MYTTYLLQVVFLHNNNIQLNQTTKGRVYMASHNMFNDSQKRVNPREKSAQINSTNKAQFKVRRISQI